jgi:hypothetical protein
MAEVAFPKFSGVSTPGLNCAWIERATKNGVFLLGLNSSAFENDPALRRSDPLRMLSRRHSTRSWREYY